MKYEDHYIGEKISRKEYNKSDESYVEVSRFKKRLTCSTARAALSVGHGGISTRDQRAGDFATHSSGVLDRGTIKLVQE